MRLASSFLKETTGLYLVGVAGLCLLLSIDLLSVLARFLVEQGATVPTVGLLLAYKLPWFLHLSMPVAAVFAVMLAAGRMGRDSELKAAQAAGIPPTALLWPVVAWGLLLSALVLVNNGMLEPRAERAYQRVIDGFLYERPPAASQRDVSYHVDGTVFHAARIRADASDPDVARLEGVLVRRPNGTLITGRNGVWNAREATWTLRDGQVVPPDGPPRASPEATVAFALTSPPEATLRGSATQTLSELRARVSQVREAGGDASEPRFELHRRAADASSTLVFTLAAAALALRLRGRSAGFAWTIALVVVFWTLWTVSGSLFEGAVLGPLVAAWSTPVVIGAMGLGLALLADRR